VNFITSQVNYISNLKLTTVLNKVNYKKITITTKVILEVNLEYLSDLNEVNFKNKLT